MPKAWEITAVQIQAHPLNQTDYQSLVADLAEIFYKHFAEQSSLVLNDAPASPPRAALLTERTLQDEAS